jgi:glucosamine--fructose-6-phosphate aminotransferase (isomerizing)
MKQMDEFGTAMEAEILEAPAAIATATAAAAEAELPRPTGVVLFARGTSEHAALYGRYLIEALAGVPVMMGAPSLATAFRAPTGLDGWLAIGVSQSGETQEIVACLDWAAERGATPLAITNAPGSALARVGQAIELGCGIERAVVATKTFVAECAALASIAYSWSSADPEWPRVIEAAKHEIAARTDEVLVRAIVEARSMTVLGRGYHNPLALEIALKVMEGCGVWATGMSWADLLHGPIAALPPGSTCLLLGESGALSASAEAVVTRLNDADVRPYVLGTEGTPIAEPLNPILEAIPAQNAVLAAARQLGRDPDSPAGLTKVTQS